MSLENEQKQAEVSEERVNELYKEIHKEVYINTQLAVIDKYCADKLFDCNDPDLKDKIILDEWAKPHNAAPASKFHFIFEKVIKEGIRNDEIHSVEEIPVTELVEYIYTYVKENDLATKYAHKYDELMEANENNIEPMTFQNYRSDPGYGWAYNWLQADIMWSKYVDQGGVDKIENVEDWSVSSSREYERALKKLIVIHGNEFVRYLRIKYYTMLSQIEAVVENMREVEHIVEEHFGKKHTDKTRVQILDAIDEVTRENPFIWIRLQEEGFKDKLIRDTEEYLSHDQQFLEAA